ncbi:MAG: glycosyltransferase family 4 protein [Candidatus Aureabacteria bacterium]|nr:glycosyltransferase family 4 protein [Candidatus Auribacterota bacterium]
MKIIYPVNKRFAIQRAHDVLVIKTCHALASAGHEVTLIMGKTCPVEKLLSHYGLKPVQNLKIVQLPILRKKSGLGVSWHFIFNFFCLKAIKDILKKEKPDFLYLSELKMAQFLLKKKSEIDMPCVYEVHGLYASYPSDENYPRANEKEGNVFNGVNGIITTTEGIKNIIRETYGIKKEAQVVPLAADSAFPLGEKTGGKFKIYYIGQLYYEQGVDFLLNAALKLENAEFHVIGGKPGEVSEFKDKARNNKLEDKIFFHGFIKPSKIDQTVKDADCFIIPSRSTGKMGYVAHTKSYEYLRYGKPIIAFDLLSIKEVLCNGDNAVLVSKNDPEALAEGIRKVMTDRGLYDKLSQNALKTSKEHTWEMRAEKLEKAFNQILETKKNGNVCK